eukprot:CAMPEP_0177672268 /NCGR_PEP_ID=MMETSP0447-20121125/25229_1 /TAXON_ID=0 /ORGANISM="Stygamoeba regulata, Strain BSH-02190019" /LENGTH=614 /DNA_ID=CAMNT_0019179881 /DNA_START=181 /DNA_END=2022 /DNA_ORIENTATION=-
MKISASLVCVALAVLCFAQMALCDVYLITGGGSNNRLDENTRERRNANRLFDSQNNNRGGVNVQNKVYYAGEKVLLEWTNQHACGPNHKTHCELIFQYACEDWIRDGVVTTRVPEDDADNLVYGVHENLASYQECKTRPRNKGLFTASQNLNGNSAQFTRQNPAGTRRGLECPEERDYYPYWHKTIWRDIVVFTDQTERCEYYQQESQNVKGKGICVNGTSVTAKHAAAGIFNEEDRLPQFPTRAACELNGNHFTEEGAFNIPPPECLEAPWSRDNHLGNGLHGEMNNYTWTVPNHLHEKCALRLRYNITTGDYKAWDGADAQQNDAQGQKLGLTEKYGYEAKFANNPQVDPFGMGFTLQLAINTAQFGRTFQDRSHRFAIREAPVGAPIHALTVRGKRGNIVQTFPSVEYDFAPTNMHVPRNHYIHMQWSGSNTNPNNNDGNGRAGTDRSNVVQCAENSRKFVYPEPRAKSGLLNSTDVVDLAAAIIEARLDPNSFGQHRGDMAELDDAGTYFSRLFKAVNEGEYNYMSTRNNDFSNRQQKATILVEDGDDDDLSGGQIAGIVLGVLGALVVALFVGVAVRMYLFKRSKNNGEDLEGYMAPAEADANVFSPLH